MENQYNSPNNEQIILGIYPSEEAAAADDFANIPVPMRYRHKWTHIMFVWFGAAMVAQLYQAGVFLAIGTGSLGNAFYSVIGGSLFLGLFVALNGVIGQSTGCNCALSSTFAYGSKGVVIPSLHIADIGWYVVNIAIFSTILHELTPSVDARVYCILFCYLFITNGYIGFNQMVILNKIAAPILIIVSIIGLVKIQTMNPGGIAALFDKIFPTDLSIAGGVTAVIGTWSAGASRSADYFRYAKSKKDAFLASLCGFGVGFFLCIGCGVIWGGFSETANIAKTLMLLGIVVLGAIMFFVQTWTTSEHSAYITSTSLPLAYQTITGKKIPRRFIVLACGIIGMMIAGLDIQNYYVPFISFLGAIIPVLGGIVIADFFIVSRTKFHWTGHKNVYKLHVLSEDLQHHKFNLASIPALIIGAWVSLGIKVGVASINGLVATIFTYIIFSIIFYYIGISKKEASKNISFNTNKISQED